MKFRIATLGAFALGLAVLAGCAGGGAKLAQSPTTAAIATRTPRPTFTSTPPLPTATRLVPTATASPTNTAKPPSPTAALPTATLSPTPEPKAMLNATQVVNVRGGPGTAYDRLGQLAEGQSFEITGKNVDGDWWQFNFNGQTAWVAASMVSANDAAAGVAVAKNIPAAPVVQVQAAAPAPAAPAPAAPPPAPSTMFAQAGAEMRNADNTSFDLVTFWGRLGSTGEDPIGGGYKMRVTAPSGSGEGTFGNVWSTAYGGYGNEFRYGVKIELPRTSGAYRAVVVDGGGKEVSDAITGNLDGTSHDVILTWLRR